MVICGQIILRNSDAQCTYNITKSFRLCRIKALSFGRGHTFHIYSRRPLALVQQIIAYYSSSKSHPHILQGLPLLRSSFPFIAFHGDQIAALQAKFLTLCETTSEMKFHMCLLPFLVQSGVPSKWSSVLEKFGR